jgi:regulator of sirC expression with transglutaminase-like and TPR domain
VDPALDVLDESLRRPRPDLEVVARAMSAIAGGVGDLPTLSVSLDSVADRVAGRLGDRPVSGPALASALYRADGLRGDLQDYASVENNRLDAVIRRRLGIPLTLGVVGVLVGRRLGCDLELVGFPGHVLVRDVETALLIDSFDGGAVATADEVQASFVRRHGPAAWRPSHLEALRPGALAGRWARNLRAAAAAAADRVLVERALAAELVAEPSGAVLAALSASLQARGAVLEAAGLLEEHAELASDPAAARLRALRLRAGLN